jgi:hypothetical protein
LQFILLSAIIGGLIVKKVKNMTLLIKTCFVLALLLTTGVYVHAQEPDDTVVSEEPITSEEEQVGEGGETEEVVDDDMADDENSNEEELTEEELELILDEAETLEEEEVESLDDFEGEIIAVTEDEVIIRTSDGEVVTVDIAIYENQLSRWRGDSVNFRKPKTGDKVESGTINTSGSNPTITTNSGTYNIPSNVTITRNGEIASLDDLEEGDDVTVLFDKDGNVIFLEMIGDIEKTSSIVLWGAIIVIVIIIILAMVSRKKKDTIESIS